MAEQDSDQQVRDEFERALGGAAAGDPCAIYLASASSAGSLGDAIQTRFGSRAKTFYDALVQIAEANCRGGGGGAR